MWERRRYRTIYHRHPAPRLVRLLHYVRDLKHETERAMFDFWQALNTRVDPTLPPDTVEARDPDGKVLGRIINLG